MSQLTTLLDDNDISLLLEIANLACHNGMPTEARTIADGVLAVRPGFVPAVITLAYSHLVMDDFDTALDMLTTVLEQNPADADARIMQGLALLLSDRKSEAEDAFAHIPTDCPQKALATELLQNF